MPNSELVNDERVDAVYSRQQYDVYLERDPEAIRSYLESKGVPTWGHGELPGTPYYKLVHVGPSTKGKKSMIILAETKAVQAIMQEVSTGA